MAHERMSKPITREEMVRVAEYNGEHRHAVLDPKRVLALLDERDALKAHVRTLRKALSHLLDDWERSNAGFPQHIELRYACRDGARAALAATEEGK